MFCVRFGDKLDDKWGERFGARLGEKSDEMLVRGENWGASIPPTQRGLTSQPICTLPA